MKIFKLMAIALVAMLGFTACDKDCEHDFIEHDHSADLVGTWTYFSANYAEALVIKADGSVVSTGVEDGEYWDGVKGNIKTVNNKMTLTFEDGDNYEGRFEMLCGEAFTIFNEEGEHMTYRYCANDLSDEIVGMWVCTEEVFGQEEESVAVNTFTEDGKSYLTAYISELNGYLNQMESNYKVIGNLLIGWTKATSASSAQYLALVLDITPNGTELGDIMTHYNPIYNTTATFVRVKQDINLNGKTYDYSSAYVTNVKGKDENFSILGDTFNISKMKSNDFDIIFGANLYCVQLNANSIKHKSRPFGQDVEVVTPIAVDGNKVTLDFSAVYSACREVEMYMFQDAKDNQLHIYMPTSSFINYFANLEVMTLLLEGKITSADTAAIEKVYTDMDARVESINVSFVLKARK